MTAAEREELRRRIDEAKRRRLTLAAGRSSDGHYDNAETCVRQGCREESCLELAREAWRMRRRRARAAA